MHKSLLQLHLAQAGRSLQRTKNNQYSDWEKQDYQAQLVKLYEQVVQQTQRQPAMSDAFIFETKHTLDFIYKSLEFLDSSTLNLIPYETVEGLKLALRDWTKDGELFIIVTSLINQIDGFSFDPALVEVDQRYDEFREKHNVLFNSRLVQINIPKALSRDYLASVVHYHELGHFVDTKYAITESISREIATQSRHYLAIYTDLIQYFPTLTELHYSVADQQYVLAYHLGEYFCDLFASQYVGASLDKYLLYLTENQDTYQLTHPASVNRSRVVNDFLAGRSNPVVDLINDALSQILDHKLAVCFDTVPPDDLYRFLPPVIETDRQLHGLLPLAWSVWQGDWSPFQQTMRMNQPLEADRVYTVLNNLIEKAIGNYIVTKKWTNSPPLQAH
jgi:hypothetical protein